MQVPILLGKNRLKERGYNEEGLVARPQAYGIWLQFFPCALWNSRGTRLQVGFSDFGAHGKCP
jgi:hypothetical protein